MPHSRKRRPICVLILNEQLKITLRSTRWGVIHYVPWRYPYSFGIAAASSYTDPQIISYKQKPGITNDITKNGSELLSRQPRCVGHSHLEYLRLIAYEKDARRQLLSGSVQLPSDPQGNSKYELIIYNISRLADTAQTIA